MILFYNHMFDGKKLAAAGHRFESIRNVPLGCYETESITRHGLDQIAPETLVKQIIAFLDSEEGAAPGLRITAFWALGKKVDSSLLSFFQSELAKEVNRSLEVCYQIMIALEDLGERIFAKDREGRSFDEHELNLRDALSYLERL